MQDTGLFNLRTTLLQLFLKERGYDGLLINRADNFSMATGGKRNLIWTYGDIGGNGLFISQCGKSYYVGNMIERDRCMEEELAGMGCGELVGGWWDSTPASLIEKKITGRFASDDGSLGDNVHGQLSELRALLSPLEQEKYRRLGKLASEAMTETVRQIKKGMRESEISAILKYEGGKRECHVPVSLIAADERAKKYRHPLASESSLLGGAGGVKVNRYVMVVGCFLREGLVVSLTRFAQVDHLPEEVLDAYARICRVDATIQKATRPGRTLGDVFLDIQSAYIDGGFSRDEWHWHHQGGAAGYAGRSCKATPGECFPTIPLHWGKKLDELLGQRHGWATAYAWNPSASGVKSEDTFLLYESGAQEILSKTPAIAEIDLGLGFEGISRSGIYCGM